MLLKLLELLGGDSRAWPGVGPKVVVRQQLRGRKKVVGEWFRLYIILIARNWFSMRR